MREGLELPSQVTGKPISAALESINPYRLVEIALEEDSTRALQALEESHQEEEFPRACLRARARIKICNL